MTAHEGEWVSLSRDRLGPEDVLLTGDEPMHEAQDLQHDAELHGAAQVLADVRKFSGQLEAAYRLNDWSPAELHSMEDALDFLQETALTVMVYVRADRQLGIAPPPRFSVGYEHHCGPPAHSDLGLVSNETEQRATFDV